MRPTQRAAPPPSASADSARAAGLDRCQGFQAIGPDGRVGVVAGVHASADRGAADEIVIVSGLFRPHVFVAGVADVVSVRRDRKRVMLSRNPVEMSARKDPSSTRR